VVVSIQSKKQLTGLHLSHPKSTIAHSAMGLRLVGLVHLDVYHPVCEV